MWTAPIIDFPTPVVASDQIQSTRGTFSRVYNSLNTRGSIGVSGGGSFFVDRKSLRRFRLQLSKDKDKLQRILDFK